MRQSHLMIWNAAVIWATRVLQVFPQLILVPFVIHRVGDAGYGIYTLAWSLMVSISEVERSLQSGVIKYSAAFLAEDRLDEVNKVVSSSFVYSMGLGLIAALGVLCAGLASGSQSHELTTSLLVVGFSIPLLVPLTPYVAVIMSRQRHYVGALADTGSKYINLLAVYLWYSFVGPSVISLVVISSILLVVSRLIQVPIAYRLVPGLHNRPNGFDGATFRLIAAFGGMTVLASLCLVANNTGVRWLAGLLVSPSFVAHLAIILMPTVALCQLVLAMTVPIMPATSAYQAVGNYHMLNEILIRSTRYSVILVLASVIGAGLAIKSVFLVWVGPEFAHLSTYSFVVFCGTAVWMSSSASHHMLKGMGKLRVTVLNAFVGLVLIPFPVFLGLLLTFDDPYVAVTAGLAIGYAVYGIMQTAFIARYTKVGLRELLVRAYIQPLLVAGIVLALTWSIVSLYAVNQLTARLIVAGTAVGLFLGAMYIFCASQAERQLVSQSIQMIQGRLTSMGRRVLGHG